MLVDWDEEIDLRMGLLELKSERSSGEFSVDGLERDTERILAEADRVLSSWSSSSRWLSSPSLYSLDSDYTTSKTTSASPPTSPPSPPACARASPEKGLSLDAWSTSDLRSRASNWQRLSESTSFRWF